MRRPCPRLRHPWAAPLPAAAAGQRVCTFVTGAPVQRTKPLGAGRHAAAPALATTLLALSLLWLVLGRGLEGYTMVLGLVGLVVAAPAAALQWLRPSFIGQVLASVVALGAATVVLLASTVGVPGAARQPLHLPELMVVVLGVAIPALTVRSVIRAESSSWDGGIPLGSVAWRSWW